jgi:protein-L-isoaspartate O-methyltransferase
VFLVTADGRAGACAHAPFDRLVAWAAASAEVPRAWSDQTQPGAVLVVPMRDQDRAWVGHYRRSERGVVETGRVPGGFIPLTAEPFRPWAAP